jgi:DNA-binding PadR family transcriptional regulator
MAKRRKVGNILALAVLTTVLQRPMHPYEMAAVLRARGKDEDFPIKWGSLYTVVRNLERHGLLEVAENERQGARPERTIYRITEAGQAEAEDWVRELVATPEPETPRFKAALSVLSILAPDDAASLLRERLTALDRQIAAQREALAAHGRKVPRLFLVEAEYDLAIHEAERAWVHSLLGELTGGSLPGLAQWRAWHETGEVPEELAEIAERGRTSE